MEVKPLKLHVCVFCRSLLRAYNMYRRQTQGEKYIQAFSGIMDIVILKASLTLEQYNSYI